MKGKIKIPAVIPVLSVDDVRKAINFYRQPGFSEQIEFSYTDETGKLIHAHLYKDESVLFPGLSDISYYEGNPRSKRIKKAKPSERGLGVTMILLTDDLGGIYNIVKKQGLEGLYQPANEYYGDRVFLFVDPFRYEWTVSQPLE